MKLLARSEFMVYSVSKYPSQVKSRRFGLSGKSRDLTNHLYSENLCHRSFEDVCRSVLFEPLCMSIPVFQSVLERSANNA